MATKKFYLKKANKQGNCSIMFEYQDRGKKFRYSTGIQTTFDLWNGKRIRGKSLETLSNNKKLNAFEDFIDDFELTALANKKKFPIEEIQNAFHAAFADEEQRVFRTEQIIDTFQSKEKTDFFTLYDLFTENSKATKTHSTIKNYGSTKTRLKDYEFVRKKKLTFGMMNLSFYEDFVNFLINERGQLNNNIGKHVKTLKTFLHYVRDKRLISDEINTKGFKVFKEDIDIVALSEEELFKLYYFDDLPECLRQTKNLFCFECFTGLRFCDASRIKPENIKGDFLQLRAKKTRDTLNVPLNRFAKEILSRYEGKFELSALPSNSNQKTNAFIKEATRRAGITETQIIEKYSGTNRIEIIKPKCDLIGTHTGRRTFITLSYEKGMPIEMIMKITGIKKWDTVKKYLHVSDKAKLIKMNEFWNNEKLNIV